MILCFSGTGNSRYIAERIAEALQDEIVDLNAKIKAADYALELVPDYTDGYTLVLVYTNSNPAFTYDGAAMYKLTIPLTRTTRRHMRTYSVWSSRALRRIQRSPPLLVRLPVRSIAAR